MNTLKVLLLTLILLSGCAKENNNKLKSWPQKCLMCGREYTVTPYKEPNKIIPPTAEWCYFDGSYCEVGFDFIIESLENEGSKDMDKRFLKHCLECKGCRCAAFSPKEWHKITGK